MLNTVCAYLDHFRGACFRSQPAAWDMDPGKMRKQHRQLLDEEVAIINPELAVAQVQDCCPREGLAELAQLVKIDAFDWAQLNCDVLGSFLEVGADLAQG